MASAVWWLRTSAIARSNSRRIAAGSSFCAVLLAGTSTRTTSERGSAKAACTGSSASNRMADRDFFMDYSFNNG